MELVNILLSFVGVALVYPISGEFARDPTSLQFDSCSSWANCFEVIQEECDIYGNSGRLCLYLRPNCLDENFPRVKFCADGRTGFPNPPLCELRDSASRPASPTFTFFKSSTATGGSEGPSSLGTVHYPYGSFGGHLRALEVDFLDDLINDPTRVKRQTGVAFDDLIDQFPPVLCNPPLSVEISCRPLVLASNLCGPDASDENDNHNAPVLKVTVTRPPCPVNGGYTMWAHSSCSATCGEGTGFRTRSCTNPAPANCGADCSRFGDSTEKTPSTCNLGPCSVVIDGGFTEWAVTSQCSTTCGAGTLLQTRKCTNPLPSNGGAGCVGPLEQQSSVACIPVIPCPVDGTWSEWTPSGYCSATCGQEATDIFTRECTGQIGSGTGCMGLDTKRSRCIPTVPRCPVNGGYSDWVTVGDCSVTCGSGRQTRSRTCNNPVPQFGGSDCSSLGSDIQTEFVCKSNTACPTDGRFTDWTQWGSCSTTCGLGNKQRTRECTMPQPLNNGNDCPGQRLESRSCYITACEMNGNWGDWQFGICSVTCGTGSQTAFRTCDNPPPVAGGQHCPGASLRTVSCRLGVCDVNGGFTEWQSGTCSVTCGSGTQTRTRSCTNPSQAGSGNGCTGITTQAGFPCTQDCDGNWSDFGKYDVCSRPCGGGTQTKSRTCTNPEPAGDGQNCPGSATESKACNTQACAGTRTAAGLGGGRCRETSGECSVTCGEGFRTIKKLCGGTVSTTSAPCVLPPCPVSAQNGGYGPWSNWGSCSVTCQTPGLPAIQTAVRVCNNPLPSYFGLNCINGGLGEAEKSRNCLISLCPIVDTRLGPTTLRSTTPLACAPYKRVCGKGLQCCPRRNTSAVRGGGRRVNNRGKNYGGRRSRSGNPTQRNRMPIPKRNGILNAGAPQSSRRNVRG